MSDLRLGPVIGRIGGAAAPIEVPITDPYRVTAELPDGEWAIVVSLVKTNIGTATVTIDGTSTDIASRNTLTSVAKRKVTGSAVATMSGGEIRSVTIFPDPT